MADFLGHETQTMASGDKFWPVCGECLRELGARGREDVNDARSLAGLARELDQRWKWLEELAQFLRRTDQDNLAPFLDAELRREGCS